eukprot:UN13431
MVPPILKFATPIFLITIIKSYFNTADPTTISLFRIIFGIGQSLVMASLFYIYSEIPKHKNNAKKIRLTQKQLEPPTPFAGMFGSPEEEDKNDTKLLKISQKDYDKSVWKKNLNNN